MFVLLPQKKGMEAVKQRLKKSKPSISIKVILTFLKPILTEQKVALWALNVHLAMQIFSWVGLRKSLYFYF